MYSADFYHRPPQHHNTITLDPADTHFSYLNTILGCWTTSSSECSTNTVTSTQKNSAIFIYRMLLFLPRRVNYIRFFITCYTFLISILCTTLRMSVFNKELLTYIQYRQWCVTAYNTAVRKHCQQWYCANIISACLYEYITIYTHFSVFIKWDKIQFTILWQLSAMLKTHQRIIIQGCYFSIIRFWFGTNYTT